MIENAPKQQPLANRLAAAAGADLRAWIADNAVELRAAIAQLSNEDVPRPPRNPDPDKPQPREDTSTLLPFDEYNHVIVNFSGGKDSVACALWAIENFGRERVELQHQCVDGRPGSPHVFDWVCTEGYCSALAEHLRVPIYFSWREGGIIREMQRENSKTAGVTFQTPTGEIHVPIGDQAEDATRRVLGPDGRVAPGMSPAWPAQSADLATRWCSRLVKVDVGRRVINYDPRFSHKPYEARARAERETEKLAKKLADQAERAAVRAQNNALKVEAKSVLAANKAAERIAKAAGRKQNPEKTRLNILVLTGERREESGARARYATCERHYSTNKFRRVDSYRPILAWPEVRVWAAMRHAGIVPHPCYWLGFGRASCETCIFAQAPEWATIRAIDPVRFDLFRRLEEWAGATITQGRSVVVQADRGESLLPRGAEAWRAQAMTPHYTLPVHVAPSAWRYPPGAFRHTAGPT